MSPKAFILVNSRVNRIAILILFTLSFLNQLSAQESPTKVFQATYRLKLYDEHDPDNTKGNVMTFRDSVTLEADFPDADRLIQLFAASQNGLPANIRFGEHEDADKLFVNPFPLSTEMGSEEDTRDAIFYYQLHNRQSVKLKFKDFSIKALSIPLKVRIGEDNVEIASDVNLGVFAGYSWGVTEFTHLKNIGNTEIERKTTLGILIGTENLEFDYEDENNVQVEEKTALLSTGIGFIYSYENFAIGITGGFDFALGENRTEWEYHARPWVGLAIGYSIFSL